MARSVNLAKGTVTLICLYVGANYGAHYFISKVHQQDQTHVSLVEQGKQIAEVCTSCHYLDQKANFVGPHLVSLIDRPIASVEGYSYSAAMKAQHGRWNATQLARFLSNPQDMIPGTKMALRGWTSEEVRALIAYFESKN